MKKIALLFFVLNASVLFAQVPGTKVWTGSQRNSQAAVQDGNASLGFVFDSTDCGLNYVQASVKLQQRFTTCCPPTQGVLQPAPFPITGIPFCAQTVKAYLWCVVAGNGAPVTATITDPLGNSQSFLMTVVGQDVDMCYGYAGAYTYRADVTSIVNGNGSYHVSGLPIDPGAANHSNDVSGATLLIIYKDPAAAYTGSLHIDDGCIVCLGGIASHTMTGFNSCANSTSGNAFMLISDLQGLGATVSVNNTPYIPVAQEDWWNFSSMPMTIAQFQDSCDYFVNSSSDCFALALTGLYTQTTCSACTPAPSGLTITTTSTTPATCPGNGAATIAVTGGSGNYTITWNTTPAQTGLSATNLPAGVNMVNVVDSAAGLCSAYSVTIPYNGPVPSMSTTGLTCTSLGSATVNVTGGTPPYLYSWSPAGGTNATAANLPAGTYTVYVTDSTGCVVQVVDSVLNTTSLALQITTLPDNCGSPAGAAGVSASGQGPYTYLWMPGGDTTESVSNLAAGTYTVNVTDNSGCSVSMLVTIDTAPLSVAVPAFSTVACGSSYQLYATASNSSATFSWQPAMYLNNPNIQNPLVTPYSNITYTVTVATPCDTITATTAVMLDPVNHHNEPICMVTVDTALHKNVVVWERSNSPMYGNFNIYRETSPNTYTLIATQPISQLTKYTDMASTPDNYPDRYRISTVDSCGVESVQSPDHRGLCLQLGYGIPTGYTLTWTPYNGSNVLSYRVYRGTNPSNLSFWATVAATSYSYNDPNPPFTALVYMVEAVFTNGSCITVPYSVFTGSLSNIASTTTIGVNENELLEHSLSISPNPGNGNFQLSFSLAQAQEIKIAVYDQLGREVYAQNENATEGKFSTGINLSSLSSGVYSVQVKTAQGFAAKRLVVN